MQLWNTKVIVENDRKIEINIIINNNNRNNRKSQQRHENSGRKRRYKDLNRNFSSKKYNDKKILQ